jgi:hypothetical protein
MVKKHTKYTSTTKLLATTTDSSQLGTQATTAQLLCSGAAAAHAAGGRLENFMSASVPRLQADGCRLFCVMMARSVSATKTYNMPASNLQTRQE